ncbi:GntR family transcriptional regulator [Paraburkholderia susongensis]|uniref:DNA-binding transcriptional regulator, GntR family n=1 Tax=Paraburkholderia susongensis TaxID=1515439 RepID=A0A1X7KMU9_9BURK|nr:GntR family transcriptional regulator [Paraburkholderia susongensis]SMG42045.1 DNA-binding transcriptional regulator, GntR family [Paraburkholderia susongensis]
MPHRTRLRHDYYMPDYGDRPKITLMLAEQIADSLAADIIKGVYAQGQQLVETTLAETYKVSRGPIRDALQLLEVEGLVTIQPRRGATVAVITPEKMKAVFEVRAVLYGLIAADLAQQCDIALFGRLRASTEALKANVGADVETYMPLWYALNRQVVEAGRNEYAYKFLSSLLRLTLPVTRKVMLDERNRGAWIADWEAVLAQIERGDVTAADATARRWIIAVYEKDLRLAETDFEGSPQAGGAEGTRRSRKKPTQTPVQERKQARR